MTRNTKFDLVTFSLLLLVQLGLRYLSHAIFGPKPFSQWFIIDGLFPSVLFAAMITYLARRRRRDERT